ncbi:MAG: HEAT repeat domain-containing protein [Planctomycetaceae bacterium]|nr:HEAT repeat domain-containing protein [Planctomycetaceae bacterium]
MKKIYYSLILFFAVASFAVAQQVPTWRWDEAPRDVLLEKGADTIKMLLSTTDENAMLNVVKQPGTEIDILRLKMFAYKRLGTHGSVKAVPVLIEKLDIEKEGFYARYALEMIPGDEVDLALIESLKNLKRPDAVAGVLKTLGVREEYLLPGKQRNVAAKAAEAAKGYLADGYAPIRQSAAYCFALNGGDAAVEFFVNPKIDAELADSGFLLAEKFLKKGEKDKVLKIYDALAAAEIRPYQKEAAVLAGILVKGNDGIPVFVQQFASEVPREFSISLKASRELPPGLPVTKTLIEQFGKQTDSFRKSLIVRTLGERCDKESLTVSRPFVADLVKTGDAKVKLAAIHSLKKIGDASVLPVLLAAANSGDEVIAVAANDVLGSLPGKEVDAAIVGLLEKGDAKTKAAAIKLIEDRRITSAYPQLNAAMKDENAEVRQAALKAIGQTATFSDFPMLLNLLVQAKAEEVEGVLVVLKSAGTRMPQADVADAIAKRFDGVSTEAKINLLELLKEIGGIKALEIVEKTAWGNDADLQDKATALLGAWPPGQEADLARLAQVCKKLATEDGRYKSRGLRGYIRLARQFNMPEEHRLAICEDALKLSDRLDDKKLIIDVYSRWPSLTMLDKAVKYLDDAELKEAACDAAVKIAEKLQGKDKKIVDAMNKVLAVSGNNAVKDKAKIILTKQ